MRGTGTPEASCWLAPSTPSLCPLIPQSHHLLLLHHRGMQPSSRRGIRHPLSPSLFTHPTAPGHHTLSSFYLLCPLLLSLFLFFLSLSLSFSFLSLPPASTTSKARPLFFFPTLREKEDRDEEARAFHGEQSARGPENERALN